MVVSAHGPYIPVSVVIPTLGRELILLETVKYLLDLEGGAPQQIIVVDQTLMHEDATTAELQRLQDTQRICWVRLPRPSITHAMNIGLEKATSTIVLFVDDDIIPGANLIRAHAAAHEREHCNIVAGQVLQPGETSKALPADAARFEFCSDAPAWVTELMGGNFSVNRQRALELGGFDENFVHVAYNFEAEFSDRARAAGERIFFEPAATIRHLKAPSGGTRVFGNHLKTFRPSHTVGAYYFFLRSSLLPDRWVHVMLRPLRAISTRHHMRYPWWILPSLLAEVIGFFWALYLIARGPRLIVSPTSDHRKT